MTRDPAAWALGELDAILAEYAVTIYSVVRLRNGTFSAVGLRGVVRSEPGARSAAVPALGASFSAAVAALINALVPELAE